MDRPTMERASRARTAWLRVMLAAGLIVVGLVSLGQVLYSISSDPFNGFRDLAVDHAAARVLIHGGNPYMPVEEALAREIPEYRVWASAVPAKGLRLPNWHPPLRLILHLPLAPLSFAQAAVVFSLLMAGCIIAATYLVAHALGWSRLVALGVGFGLLATPLIRTELGLGQTQGLLLLLLVLAWRSNSGFWLGVATAIKIFPGFFFLPLLGLRRYRSVFTGVATALLLLAVPWLLLGAHPEFFARLGAWNEWRSADWNISAHGVFTATPAVAYLVSLILVVIGLRPAANASRDVFWAATPLWLLAWPIVWSFYLLLAIPWLMLAIARSDGVRRAVMIGIAIVFALHLPGLALQRGVYEMVLLISPLMLCVGVAVEAGPRLGRNGIAGVSVERAA